MFIIKDYIEASTPSTGTVHKRFKIFWSGYEHEKVEKLFARCASQSLSVYEERDPLTCSKDRLQLFLRNPETNSNK